MKACAKAKRLAIELKNLDCQMMLVIASGSEGSFRELLNSERRKEILKQVSKGYKLKPMFQIRYRMDFGSALHFYKEMLNAQKLFEERKKVVEEARNWNFDEDENWFEHMSNWDEELHDRMWSVDFYRRKYKEEISWFESTFGYGFEHFKLDELEVLCEPSYGG